MGFVKQQSVLLESFHPDVGKIFTDPWNTEDSKFKTKVGFLIRDFSSLLGSLETLAAVYVQIKWLSFCTSATLPLNERNICF